MIDVSTVASSAPDETLSSKHCSFGGHTLDGLLDG